MDPVPDNTGLDIPQREIISRSPAPYYDPTDKLFVAPRGGRTGRLHLSLRRDTSLNVTKAERTHDVPSRLSSIPSSIHFVLLCCTRYDYCVMLIEIPRIIFCKILARGSLLIIGEDIVTLEIFGIHCCSINNLRGLRFYWNISRPSTDVERIRNGQKCDYFYHERLVRA